MKAKLLKLKQRHAWFSGMLQSEDALSKSNGNGDRKIREQYLSGKISGLKEAIDVLEGRKIEETQS